MQRLTRLTMGAGMMALMLVHVGCICGGRCGGQTQAQRDVAVAAPADTTPDEATRTVEEYWPNGALRERRTVIDGPDGAEVLHGPFTRWYRNGAMEYEATFVRGRMEGVERRWHDNAVLATEQHYLGGERHGVGRRWDNKGNLRQEENHFHGQPDGTWTVWTASGKLKAQSKFDKGRVVTGE